MERRENPTKGFKEKRPTSPVVQEAEKRVTTILSEIKKA
jgi:hypothetical protein